MEIDVNTIIAFLGAMGGFELIKWIITSIANRKNNKKLKDVEVKKAKTDAEADSIHLYMERIKELRESNKEVNAQNLELIKDGAKKDDIIQDKVNQIRKLNEDLVKATRYIGYLDKLLQFYKSWFCRREFGYGKNDCRRRDPEQNPPLKFTPIEDVLEEDVMDEINENIEENH